jgi:uroporphyrinogen decarboxylase
MNGLERVRAALSRTETDRVPVVAQVFGHAAVLAGVPLRDYLQDGEQLARCQIGAWEHYSYDAVFALMDTSVETEAAGSVLTFPRDRYPHVASYALQGHLGPGSLRMPDPLRDGRMPELLKAARILRREVGDQALVVGCVLGPLSLAVQLLGAEAALFQAIDHPEAFGDLLDFATEVAIRFGTAQLEAGVHLPLVFDPSATPEMVPPQFFREFELPRLTRLFEAFRRAGAVANWLHIAGKAGPILPYYAAAGVDLANFDYCVGPEEAQREASGLCLDGNVKPLAFVEATSGQIKEEASQLQAAFAGRGGFVLSSGCEIPPEAKPENIAALVHSSLARS